MAPLGLAFSGNDARGGYLFAALGCLGLFYSFGVQHLSLSDLLHSEQAVAFLSFMCLISSYFFFSKKAKLVFAKGKA